MNNYELRSHGDDFIVECHKSVGRHMTGAAIVWHWMTKSSRCFREGLPSDNWSMQNFFGFAITSEYADRGIVREKANLSRMIAGVDIV